MDRINEKLQKQENCLTKLLRKLLKQKEDTINKTQNENEQLRELVLKQQELLYKLNNENMQISKDIHNLKATIDIKSSNNDIYKIDLIEQNKSLKEQLLVSQYHNSIMANDLNEAKLEINVLTKNLARYE